MPKNNKKLKDKDQDKLEKTQEKLNKKQEKFNKKIFKKNIDCYPTECPIDDQYNVKDAIITNKKILKKDIDGYPIECQTDEQYNEEDLPADAIIANKINIQIGNKKIIENGNIKLVNNNRYGLLGPNGSGKTTFLKCLKHRLISSHNNLNIIEVEQTFISSNKTVYQTILETNYKLFKIKNELDEMELQEDYDSNKLNELYNKLDELNYHTNEATIKKILYGLGFTQQQMNQSTSSFSGGWQRRIALAKVLYLPANLLLLDEPTNHLDLEAVIWLSEYLLTLKCIMVIVSHSSDFLDRVCNQTIFMVNKIFKQFKGNYSEGKYYLNKENISLEKEYKKKDNKLKELSKKHTSKKEKENFIKTLNLEPLIQKYNVIYPKYKCPNIKGDLVTIENLNFSYSIEKILLQNINLVIPLGKRYTLVGKNGTGKSTLLKIINGDIKLDCVNYNSVLKVGYYHQHFDTLLPKNETPVSYLLPLMSDDMNIAGEPTRSIRQFLGQIKLEGKAHLQKIKTLSGGQKARVAWLAMILKKPHLIILDEPTNHMDLEGIEGMINSLELFNGSLLIVTHDPTLITKLNTDLLILENNNLTLWKNDYEQYIEKVLLDLETQH